MNSPLNRRRFMELSSAAAVGTALAPLGFLNARIASAQPNCSYASMTVPGFGPLAFNQLPLNTSQLGTLAQIPLIALPPGFVYTAISLRGSLDSDGKTVPGGHDGMACFQGRSGTYVLVRNHELNPTSSSPGCLTSRRTNDLGRCAPQRFIVASRARTISPLHDVERQVCKGLPPFERCLMQ